MAQDVDAGTLDALAAMGVATVYEAAGRSGLVDIALHQIVPGSRVAGPARTVRCGQDDNLMVHAAIEHIRTGEVLVLSMPAPAPVALVGDLLATQAKVRGAAGLLIDASARDVDELVALGLPIWARFVRVRGASKREVGALGVPVEVGGATVRTGDIVVMDADGAVVVERERVDEVLDRGRARLEKEVGMRQRLRAGELSLDIHGLRAVVEGVG
jgi:4-hydroxy-4-methyl-2-oxoglutarate aldolase